MSSGLARTPPCHNIAQVSFSFLLFDHVDAHCTHTHTPLLHVDDGDDAGSPLHAAADLNAAFQDEYI